MDTKIIKQAADQFMMLSINVSDMPRAKAFYADKIGLRIMQDFRHNDDNWWVTLTAPEGGVALTLARATAYPETIKPGMLALYFATSDVVKAHQKLTSEGVQVSDIQDNLFGPGSGVKFFNLKDPDGNLIHLVQKHEPRIPF